MPSENATHHILQSLFINLLIATGKGIGAFMTGSGAMLAETIHSFADCSNQLLLLLGVKGAQRPPSPSHPLGYGRDAYFWSFMVALLLFSGGGVFSVYEGIHKFSYPEAVEHVAIGIGIILVALLLEGYATWSNIQEFDRLRGTTPLPRYLRETKDSSLVVLFGENAAATLGLLFALVAQLLAWVTHDSRWDALGCLCIGLVLIAVAIFLAIEVKSLLVGERASLHIEEAVREVARQFPAITHVLHIITLQQGPGQIVLLAKVGFNPALDVASASDTINQFEDAVREKLPEVRFSFIEPDMPRVGARFANSSSVAKSLGNNVI